MPAEAPIAPPAAGTATAPVPGRRGPVLALAITAALAAMLTLLLPGGGLPPPSPEGIPDPGRLTVLAIPVLGLVVQTASVVLVGMLLLPLLLAIRIDEELTASGARALRVGRWSAVLVAVAGLAELWFTVSDQLALVPQDVRLADVYSFAWQIPQGRSALTQVVLVLLVAAALRWVVTAREAAVLLGLSLVALVPPILTGHATSAGSHDLAVVGLVLHVLPAALWVGGLLAIWGVVRTPGGARLRALGRFSGLAAWCFGLVAVSGVVSGLVRVGSVGEILTTPYGLGVVAKAAVLVVLGLLARSLRAWVVAAAERGTAAWRSFATLTAAELTLMATAIGLGVALSRTPPPTGEPYTELAASLLGGPLPAAPTAANLLWGFKASGVGLAVVLLGATAYAVGVRTLRRRGESWSVGRSVAWALGLLLFGYATVGGLGVYSHVMFSAHMASHMVLSMVAPILLVLGAPINLALRALPGPDRPGGQGPRQLLAAFLRTRFVRLLAHPAIAALLFVGSLYAIYYTSVFDALMTNHLGHAFMELHFLLVGYLFYEVLIGSAPIPHRLPHLGRLLLVLVVAPFHAFFSIGLMSMTRIVGGDFYSLLDRPYATDLLRDQEVGGSLSWAVGEIPIVIVAIAILVQWFRSDQREARRFDRREDASEDAALAAYNEMLARAARNEPRGPR